MDQSKKAPRQVLVQVKGSVGNSYSAVVEAMGAGQVDIGWLNPFSYVLAHNKYGVEPLLIQQKHRQLLQRLREHRNINAATGW